MKIGVLGTGSVGSTLSTKFSSLGHSVTMGARDAANEKARAWVASAGRDAAAGTFADAAAFGEIVFNATAGKGTIEAVRAAGKDNLRGKILVDVSNPLDFSRGMPPTLFAAAAGDSLGEQVQKTLPDTRVVKALKTMNASVMVDPARAHADSDAFLCGDDAEAKSRVSSLLRELGWKSVRDLGGIASSRGMEAYVLFWLTLRGSLETADFNIRIVGA